MKCKQRLENKPAQYGVFSSAPHTQTQEESKRCSAHRRRRRPRRRRQQCETRLSVVQTRTRPFESTFQLLLKQNLPSLAVRAGVPNTFEKPNRNSHPPPAVRKPVSSPVHTHFTHTHTCSNRCRVCFPSLAHVQRWSDPCTVVLERDGAC